MRRRRSLNGDGRRAEALIQAGGGLLDRATCGRPGEARPSADAGLARSPTSPHRRIGADLTLHDGGSRLTGGLVSGNRGAGATGVPVSGRLPVPRRRFRTGAAREGRAESMVMSTPVVVAGHEDGGVLTRGDAGAARSARRDSAMRCFGTGSASGSRCSRTEDGRAQETDTADSCSCGELAAVSRRRRRFPSRRAPARSTSNRADDAPAQHCRRRS